MSKSLKNMLFVLIAILGLAISQIACISEDNQDAVNHLVVNQISCSQGDDCQH